MNINDVAFELFRIILLALVLERVLAAIYEVRWPFPKSANNDPPIMLGDWLSSGAKAIIAMSCSVALAYLINLHMLDALANMQTPQVGHELKPVAEWVDHLFSGLIVSGGSAAANVSQLHMKEIAMTRTASAPKIVSPPKRRLPITKR